MNLLKTDEYRTGGYAVVDFETTGLFPGGTDRVIEVAVVRLDSRGSVVAQYSSLVNPERDMGPTHKHHINASDVARAPVFSEIAGDVLALIRDAVFVAHNADFDRRFLRAEMSRMGMLLPALPTLCTMQLATKIGRPVPGRKLEVLCEHFGIELGQAHAALADAEATAEILRICVQELGGWASFDLGQFAINERQGDTGELWPDIQPTGRSYCRPQAVADRASRKTYISRLVARLPHGSSSDQESTAYLACLDRALEDRRIVKEEYEQLLALACEIGLSREQAIKLHCDYMRSLMLAALEDDVITEDEQRDLEDVRQLLGLTDAQAESAMQEARLMKSQGAQRSDDQTDPSTAVAGKSVCFTGTLQCSLQGERATRSMAREAAEAAGMTVQKGVTRTLDYLVVADPNSMSGKATKARDYGVRILAEPVFWRRVGMAID